MIKITIDAVVFTNTIPIARITRAIAESAAIFRRLTSSISEFVSINRCFTVEYDKLIKEITRIIKKLSSYSIVDNCCPKFLLNKAVEKGTNTINKRKII